MKFVDSWHWPDGEVHMLEWMSNPKNRRILNGRPTYQGKKQKACFEVCATRTHMRTAVDVGAHIGLWAFNLAHWFKQVEAFEPMATHRECFEKNVLADAGVVALHAVALGDREGSVSMSTNPTSSGDTWVKGDGDIPLRTLDSFALQDVDFLKIDCEGFEEKVVRGAADMIKRCRPVICVEQKRDFATKFGMKPQGAVTFLQGLGYKVHTEIGGDYICVPK